MKSKAVVLVALALASMPALAQATPDISIVNTITTAISAASGKLIMPKAIVWLSSLMALQFVLTNVSLLKSGSDIEAVFSKLIGSFAWFGFCAYLLNNGPDFIDSVGHDLLNTFATNLPSPGSIITATLSLCTTLLAAIVITGTSVIGNGNSAVANVLIIVLLTVFSVGMFMAIKILMISLELALVVMLSPLSFSLLGLNALKDQGIAPLKSLISLAYRIILLGILCAAFSEVENTVGIQLKSIAWSNPTQWGDALKIIFSMLCAYPIIAYFVFKSDAIAASLASGTTNLGTADVASAAAIGASAGAAVATGGASVAAGATNTAQSMGEFMKGLVGSGGASLSNASSNGAGSSSVGLAPQKPSMSIGASGASGPTPPSSSGSATHSMVNKPPVRPTPVSAESNARPNGSGSNVGSRSLMPEQSLAARSAVNQSPSNGKEIVDSLNSLPGRSANSQAGTSATSSPENGGAPANGVSSVESAAGSFANAGIAGANGPSTSLEQQVGDLVQTLNRPRDKKGVTDHLSELNQHVALEQASTHVSVNTHHSD